MNRRGFFGALATLALAPAAAVACRKRLFPWQEDIVRQVMLVEGDYIPLRDIRSKASWTHIATQWLEGNIH